MVDLFKKFINFLKEVRRELKNVTWPTKQEVRDYTVVAFIVMIVVAFFLWAVNMCLEFAYTHVTKLFT
jgi:preprotein translocase subunit SecE